MLKILNHSCHRTQTTVVQKKKKSIDAPLMNFFPTEASKQVRQAEH